MPTIQVQVLSGLASRMRAFIGAVDWAKRHNAHVIVGWPWKEQSETLREFPVWFSELFHSLAGERRMPGPENWPKEIKPRNGGWFVRTCDPATFGVVHSDAWPHREFWMPTATVLSQVNALPWPAGKVVGVHIRSALAQPTTPPVEWFLKRMLEIHNAYRVRFFLSCDSKATEDAVLAEYPDTIRQERTYRYDSLGIVRAAADLFLLERCDWMIGSYNSSFSELAGWIRGGEYQPGWGREGWMAGGRYEDARTPAVGIEEVLG